VEDPRFRDQLKCLLADKQALAPCRFGQIVFDPLAAWIESTFGVRREPDSESGFICVSSDLPWPQDGNELFSRVSEDWLDADGRLLTRRRKHLPQAVCVGADGRLGGEKAPSMVYHRPIPVLFALRRILRVQAAFAPT